MFAKCKGIFVSPLIIPHFTAEETKRKPKVVCASYGLDYVYPRVQVLWLQV